MKYASCTSVCNAIYMIVHVYIELMHSDVYFNNINIDSHHMQRQPKSITVYLYELITRNALKFLMINSVDI